MAPNSSHLSQQSKRPPYTIPKGVPEYCQLRLNSTAIVKLLDRVREAIRLRHYTKRTEETYIYWIRYFIKHHGNLLPTDLNASHARDFLTHLAISRNVTPNTQKVALNALVFLYVNVLNRKEVDCRDSVRQQGHASSRLCSPETSCRPSSPT